MLPDVNKLARLYFEACRSYLSEGSDKVHIFVRCGKAFLEKHPFLANYLTVMDGVTFIILNVSHQAARDLEYGDYSFTFNARFKGVPYNIEVCFGDVIGMGHPGQEYLYDFATIPLAGITGTGSIALRPLTADALLEFERERAEVLAQVEKAKRRPKLVAVK
jgi:hypothetical protein